ncbi:MAG: prepilin-type N-terminal cleavage/methylation domain-containing protein [Phycisphaerae bacterium]
MKGQGQQLDPAASRHWRAVRAFTLIEMLVVVFIISLLLTILMPALSKVRADMKMLKCSSNMRNIAFKFQLFAEGENAEGRGDSDRRGRRSFFVNDFQESLYRIDEFWDKGKSSTGTLTSSEELMLCPAGAPQLDKRRGFPCSSAAIGPPDDISLAVNMRLYRAEIEFMGRRVLAPVASTSVRRDVLSHPYVPLMLDVDGEDALARRVQPFYTAPAVDETPGPYSDGGLWMPSKRHGGRTNVVFVGGHVLTSQDPASEPWDWAYQAHAGR